LVFSNLFDNLFDTRATKINCHPTSTFVTESHFLTAYAKCDERVFYQAKCNGFKKAVIVFAFS